MIPFHTCSIMIFNDRLLPLYFFNSNPNKEFGSIGT